MLTSLVPLVTNPSRLSGPVITLVPNRRDNGNTAANRHVHRQRGSTALPLGANGFDSCRPQKCSRCNGEDWTVYRSIRAASFFWFHILWDQWLRHRQGGIRI